ncbi:DOMON-like domain-containing protein [Methylocaldum sp.]|uniref:DOMON-like domain-containing protein n=1 Tax=Methylocaldum sp. TaxID=1969727 RepID=UPI002D5005AE|nr:DOMON-like domain-containing protein [Methylocaldum sp.]HYE37849.1 DOMON-like domain-containing protein [Methylocaldum sp.]
MQAIPLNCHPSIPCELIRRFTVRTQRTSDGMLALDYAIEGDIAGLRIPSPCPARRADGLWQHTCFEAFLMHGEGYYEFNFAPSTEWAIYRFSAYREGMSVVPQTRPPKIALTLDAHRLELNTLIRLNDLPIELEGANLRLGVSAVIEEEGGRLSYWALMHPPGKPDFHHPDNFVLELDSTDNA